MNAALLIALSEAISDHPFHVQQLRKIVVALAVSGRLDKREESLSRDELLVMLEEVRASLVAKRLLPKQKQRETVTSEQLPENFSDPSSFIPLGEVARVEKGKSGIQQTTSGDYPLVVTAADRLTADHFDFDGAAAIIPLVSSTGHGNASINRLHYQEGQFALGTILAAVLPFDQAIFSARFLFEYLSAFKDELLVARMSGTANVTLTLGRIEEVPIPLVPPAVQRQVDELMALCDQWEAARVAREATRDRLAAASLARLNTPDPETFPEDALFALNALPALTARPDQIKQMRQTILNLAVRGKLVPQDPADEPAEELLRRIAALPWGKKRKLSALELDDDALAFVFQLPSGWAWTSVDAIVRPNETVTYGILKPEWVADGVPTVRVTEMKTGVIDVTNLPKCHPSRAAKFQKTKLSPGDLLISKDGTIGKTAFVPPELEGGNITQHVLRFPICDLVARQYVRLAIDAPVCQAWMVGETKGVALQGVNVGDFRRMPIPLPPLAEQHRIIAKVDELMALCDQLGASLTTADETRSKLLDALLADALTPIIIDDIKEAAE